jgi:hypothetical protein
MIWVSLLVIVAVVVAYLVYRPSSKKSEPLNESEPLYQRTAYAPNNKIHTDGPNGCTLSDVLQATMLDETQMSKKNYTLVASLFNTLDVAVLGVLATPLARTLLADLNTSMDLVLENVDYEVLVYVVSCVHACVADWAQVLGNRANIGPSPQINVGFGSPTDINVCLSRLKTLPDWENAYYDAYTTIATNIRTHADQLVRGEGSYSSEEVEIRSTIVDALSMPILPKPVFLDMLNELFNYYQHAQRSYI